MLLLTSCATRTHYIPDHNAGLTVAGDRATARNEVVNVSVDHTYFDSYAYGGDDKFIIFRVGIRNLSPTPITFTPEQFLLIDDTGKQYSAMPPQLVAAAGGPFECAPRGGVGMGWGGWHPRWGGSSNWGWGMGYYSHPYDCSSRFSEEVISQSLLPAAPLQPNARMTGSVYFRGKPDEVGSLRLEIHFPNASPLKFPFRPEPED